MPNDYLNALNAYDKTNKSALSDPREIEVRALFKSADALEALQQNWENSTLEDREEALKKNEKLWTIFTAEMEKEDTGLDISLRSNIANLGIYIFKRSLEIRSQPEAQKLNILISINRNIAMGLQDSIKLTKQQQGQAMANNQTNPAPDTPPTAQNNPYETQTEPPTSPTDIDI